CGNEVPGLGLLRCRQHLPGCTTTRKTHDPIDTPMFENAELGHAIDKAAYKQAVPGLRASLLEAQRQLATAPFSVLVLGAGSAAAGKSEAVDLLLEWLDARGAQTHAMRKRTDEERQRPPMWRYWRDLPPRGRMGIFFGGWESDPLLKCLRGKIDRDRLGQMI